MKPNITNTARTEIHPEYLFGGAPHAIEAQEARGQAELVKSEQLPTDGLKDLRTIIETNGGTIGEPCDGDGMFTNVELPEGWQKKPTDHSMWSELVDASGTKVASIFYKAAFYDRSAFIRFG